METANKVCSTALRRLSKEGNVTEIKRIVDSLGRDALGFDERFRSGTPWYTPLHEAAANGLDALLDYWLELGFDVNCRTPSGDTPLHVAAGNGCVGCVRVLLKYGADLTAQNNIGKSPRQSAEQCRQEDRSIECVCILRSEEIIKDVEKDGDSWIEVLLDNPHLLPDCLSRALIAAVMCDNPSNVGTLVSKGASNVTECLELAVKERKHNAHAMLLLMIAATKNDCDLVQKLFTEQESGEELEEVRKALTEKNVFKTLPFEVACRWDNKQVAEELLLWTEVYMREGIVFWSGLELNVIENTMLSKISWVKVLDLSHNKLVHLPFQMNLFLQNVTKLNVQFNQLSTIPGAILELPNLVDLNISNNRIATFPHLSKWSSSLITLDVSSNRLNTIPGEPSASSITTLNLANNDLKAVPLCICGFKTLQSLDLSNNAGIIALPVHMYKLKGLAYLNLKGLDNLSGIPICIRQNPQRIVDYLKSKSLPTCGYYRMKLMLVGKQNRGKTTLAARLQGKGCGNTSTVGVDVDEWEYKPSLGKKCFQFSIWDFGGQEEYYTTHQCFLSDRALYVVLFNLLHGTRGVEEMVPWLNNIAIRAPKSRVLIVGTHLDEIPLTERKEKADEVLQRAAEVASSFTNRLVIYQVSAVGLKDPFEGVANLRDSIYQCAAEYKLSNGEFVMGQKIPISYCKLDRHILWYQKQAKKCHWTPIMNREEFKALVKELNLADLYGENELKLAASFLTDIGTIIHYDDHSHHLNELYFLDPQWLCDMMAKIVTVKEKNPFVTNGILATKDIPLLFRCETFPWQYFKQCFALLDRFEIALALDTNRMLIPSMLSEEQPDGVDIAGNQGKPLYKRIITFNSLSTPPGFWSRLICRIIHAIPTAQRTSADSTFDSNAKPFALINSTDQLSIACSVDLTCESTIFDRSLSISTTDSDSSNYLLTTSGAAQGKLLYWRTGLFYRDDQVTLKVESLSSTKYEREGVEINATLSALGRSLVSKILDFVAALVKDWYPGLQNGGPLEQIVLCCECIKLNRTDPYQFDVQSCLSLISQNVNSIDCKYSKEPSENHSVFLVDIVPDLLLQDISMRFFLNISELDYKEEEDSLLGDGGFGKVYRGKCHGQPVAIKRYLNGSEALSELRKEATILQQFRHPCLVCLVGVCVHPIMAMVLEEAPMGSLEKPLIKKQLPVHRLVIHRIAVQITAALNFLHTTGIIFRDLKAANVLLWSLDPESLFHCKLADFGIATNATPIGTRGIIGTKGFIAPEVLHIGKNREHSLYDHKADIFSFGMLLYQMICRRHPFHDMLPVKIDSAIENGERPRLDDVFGAENVYLYLSRLMQRCWQADPRQRPDTAEIIGKLCLSSFQSLMSVKPVLSKFSQCKVSVVAQKLFSDIGAIHRESEIWTFSTVSTGTEITIYSANALASLSSRILNGIRIECIGQCTEYVWAASKAESGYGIIDVFSIITREPIQKILLNSCTVSCMACLDQVMYCGTFEGVCVSLCKNTQQNQFVVKGNSVKFSDSAIDGIVVTIDCVWLSHSCKISLLKPDTLDVIGELNRRSSPHDFIGKLYVSEDKATIWSCQLIGSSVSSWSTDQKTHNFDINITDYISQINKVPNEFETSITAVLPVLDTVWIGLEGGYVLIFYCKELLLWFQPYKSYINFLLFIPCNGQIHLEKSTVVSGGKLFNAAMIPDLIEFENTNDQGVLVKWEAFSSKTCRQIFIVQSQSPCFLQNHERAKRAIKAGGFKDCTFLTQNL